MIVAHNDEGVSCTKMNVDHNRIVGAKGALDVRKPVLKSGVGLGIIANAPILANLREGMPHIDPQCVGLVALRRRLVILGQRFEPRRIVRCAKIFEDHGAGGRHAKIRLLPDVRHVQPARLDRK